MEQVRLGIPTEQPLAVAVNYAARAAGIVRHGRVSGALRKVDSPLHSLFSYYEPSRISYVYYLSKGSEIEVCYCSSRNRTSSRPHFTAELEGLLVL